MDAAYQTYKREGFFGFYRGLIPSLAKVVSAVSISYVVYEQVCVCWWCLTTGEKDVGSGLII